MCLLPRFVYCPGEFESRVFEYREEMEEMETSLALNMKSVGKKMINFFFESGIIILSQWSSRLCCNWYFIFADIIIIPIFLVQILPHI